MTQMKQTIFYTSLTEFCREAFAGSVPSLAEQEKLVVRGKIEEANIFEQFLLFDKIAFKVQGENRVIPFLLAVLKQKGLEELIDQDAIRFTLWTPSITYLITEVPGLDPLQYGMVTSPGESDPEQSLELGLRASKLAMDRRVRRHLAKKLLPLHQLPGKSLGQEAVQLVHSSARSGKLQLLGAPGGGNDIRNLKIEERKKLCECATELLEYAYLVDSGMTSFSNGHYYALFNHSVDSIEVGGRVSHNFKRVATVEGIPDLKAFFGSIENPFGRLPKLRAKHSAIKFRDWLATASQDGPDTDIISAYIEALNGPKGFFETKAGRVTKAISMTAIGTGVGALIAGKEGALGGAAATKILEPVADLGIDLIDEFFLAGLLKGWNPRMFFNELKKLPRAD
jgi:hypothetical protein